MNNLELDAMVLLEKLTKRISDDARTIAMLEATIDVYRSQMEEMAKQITLLQSTQEQ